MDTLNDIDDNGGGVQMDQDQNRSYAMEASQIEQDEMTRQQKHQLVTTADVDEDSAPDGAETDKGHLAIPEIIEILKNLAACKEKLFKWEQSVSNLESMPDSDPNKSHLMEIIDL